MCEECKSGQPLYQIGNRFREAIEDYISNLITVEIPQYIEIEQISSEPSTAWGYKYFVKQVYASGRIDFCEYSEGDLYFNFKQFSEVAE